VLSLCKFKNEKKLTAERQRKGEKIFFSPRLYGGKEIK